MVVSRCKLYLMRRLLAVLCMAAVLPAAWAERYALLVGVGEVVVLPPRLWLHGPDNDVALMRQALLARGLSPQHITVLARGVPGAAALPTYAAITGAMAVLRDQVRPGDSVVLHLAGHGAQVPQAESGGGAGTPWPEPDGLDEVFLATDVGRWDDRVARLPRALRDDEIGDWIDALVDRGATVWAVFDTCHAAGMARGSGSTRWRNVAAAELGVPAGAVSSAQPGVATAATGSELGRRSGRRSSVAASSAAGAAPRLDGRVLAYAARAHEATGEEWLPRGGGLARARMHGVFSHAVAQALAEGADSAAALRVFLRQRYARDGRVAPVPQVVGDGALFR